jgi:hypothetical protein
MMRDRSGRFTAAAAALAANLALPTAAPAQSHPSTAMDDRWHFFAAPYLWASGMEGRVGVSGVVEVPVDVSFGDTLENLDFGFLGRFEGRRNRIGFGADLIYMNLGADVTGPVSGQLGLGADVRSFTAEGILNCRVSNDDARGSYVDLLGGLRYVKNEARLTVERGGNAIAGTGRTLDWVDGVAGARFRLGLGRSLGIHGRADIAGFGSDLSWNVQGGVELSFGGGHWRTGAGYRYFEVDYDKGEGLDRRVWQIVYQGPYAFIGYGW